jgi:hypothetical protein
MKTFIIILLCVVGFLIGFYWLIKKGITIYEDTNATYSEGNDTLRIVYNRSTDWGVSRSAMVLYLNDKIVDFHGSLIKQNSDKLFPSDERAVKNLRVDTIAAPDTSTDVTTWTVWVNPKDFTSADYEKIVGMLKNGSKTLLKQHLKHHLEREQNLHPNPFLRHQDKPVHIWRTVYFDYSTIKDAEL